MTLPAQAGKVPNPRPGAKVFHRIARPSGLSSNTRGRNVTKNEALANALVDLASAAGGMTKAIDGLCQAVQQLHPEASDLPSASWEREQRHEGAAAAEAAYGPKLSAPQFGQFTGGPITDSEVLQARRTYTRDSSVAWPGSYDGRWRELLKNFARGRGLGL